MFKIISEISYVEYDQAIEEMLEVARKNPQISGQIPAFINADMIKQMPQEMKNGMLVNALGNEKQKGIQMVESMAAKAGIPIRVKDLVMEAPNEPNCVIRLQVEGTVADYDAAISMIIPRLLQNEDLKDVLGDNYKEGMTVADGMAVMKSQPEHDKEFYIIKTLSMKKEVLKQELQAMAAMKHIELQIAALRFMLPR